MGDLERQLAIDSEEIFRDLETAWLASDAADDIDVPSGKFQEVQDILSVVTCGFGMAANVMRTSAAAIELTAQGFGAETGPLVRLTYEHAMAIQALVNHGIEAVEAFGRAHAGNLQRLQGVSAFGVPGVHEEESAWMDEFRQAAAATTAGPADNGIKIATLGKSDDAMAVLYYGWLRTTQTSHAGIMTSRSYVRINPDESDGAEIQRMFISDYEHVDARILLVTPVIEALIGYTKLGPTNLNDSLPPILQRFDSINAEFTNAKAVQS